MDSKLLLVKCITLLYRESQLVNKSDNSADLVKTVLENLQVSNINIGINIEREVILALKETVLEMCRAPLDHEYILQDLLQSIRLNTYNDDKLYEIIKQGLEDEKTEAQLKRIITNITITINNYFKERKIADILNKASHEFNYKSEKIKDINQFISELMGQLEPLQITNSNKDPAVVSDIDIGNEESLREAFNEIQFINSGTHIYKTGWQALNRMLQGGIRQGETIVIPALQHKFKTGFGLSLFSQIALYNKPLTTDVNKKPLLLRISFEDDLISNLQFLYQYLKFNETRQHVDIDNIETKDMADYVKAKLQVNGFHVKLLRVDPTQWTYKSICNKVIELEAQGYNVEVLALDYLAMVPTIGCVNTGPMGTDLRDLFRRMRNFCAPKKITLITPHQLSTDAKNIIRSGTPEDHFVKEIAEKGYYSGTKQLDQEVDVEIYIHLFKHNKETYFSVQRGKHRIPTIINDEDKYYLMKFPKKMPLPDDIYTEDQSFKKLPSASSNVNDDLFKLG